MPASNATATAAAPAAAAAAAARPAALVWLRRDLRLADNEPLHAALQKGTQPLLLPFFCLDERELAVAEGSLLGLPQLGPHRLRRDSASEPPARCRHPCTLPWPAAKQS